MRLPLATGNGAASFWAWTVGLVALAIVAPFFLYPVFLMNALCMALFACAFNLLIGYVGLLSFGHAAFMGMGSYLAAYSAKTWGLSPELAILTGVAVAAVLGLVFGYLAIRRQGIYFAMITLAFAQMVYFFCVQAPFTGGEDGLRAVPRGHLFGMIDLADPLTMYYFVLAVFLIGFGLIVRTIHSPFGQVLKAIRENEPRAISLGYNADRYKLMAFVLSAALSGLAGGTKAIVFQFASLTDVFWTMSGLVVLMTLIGGIGTILGPVVGAFIIVTMETYLVFPGRLLGHDHRGRDLRDLRADLPPGDRRGYRAVPRRPEGDGRAGAGSGFARRTGRGPGAAGERRPERGLTVSPPGFSRPARGRQPRCPDRCATRLRPYLRPRRRRCADGRRRGAPARSRSAAAPRARSSP